MFFGDANGIEITLYAFESLLGNFGNILVAITITLFAVSTVIAGYYYGESSLKYLKAKCTSFDILVLKLITLIVIVFSSIVSSYALWQAIDVLVAILAIINIYSLFGLRKVVIEEYKYFKMKRL